MFNYIFALRNLAFILLLCAHNVYAFCVENSNICAEGPETRIINGHSVTRDCWRYQLEFSCSGTTATPDAKCQELIDAGCSPVASECDATSCMNSYQCNTGTTTTPTGVGCDTQSFDVGGLKYDTGYDANTDFGVAASSMAAMESAVTGMVKDDASCAESPAGSGIYVCATPILIFNGKGLACRKDSLGFNKCCNLKGWGTDIGLASCNAEEHELGYARDAGRSHYVGRYCTKSNIFGCYGHKYVYCSFPSKIGRIIQEQGRLQLGKGWGTPTAPQCAGFSETELMAINFDLIDFSEYFTDAFDDITNPPSQADMNTIVNTYIDKLKGASCSQFDSGCVEDLKK